MQDTGCSISIVPDNDGGGFTQAQVDATGNGVPAPSDAYLVTTLSVVPKSLTCSFRFRPDTDFHTGDPGLDFFIIEIDHEDSTSVLLRFSFKDGDLEIRDDHLDRNEQCAPCSVTDPKTPASDIAQNKWSNITVTTDFVNVSVSSDATTVHDVVQNVGNALAGQAQAWARELRCIPAARKLRRFPLHDLLLTHAVAISRAKALEKRA